MNLCIFNIWHNKLFDELYEEQNPADMNHIVMFNVNPHYKKIFNAEKNYQIVNEWDLKQYNPKLQEHGYCQTTAMYHIYINNLHRGLDYIGFIQYDMKLGRDLIEQIKNTNAPTVFYSLAQTAQYALQWHTGYDLALAHYNSFFGTDYEWKNICTSQEPLVLLHTFIIPVDVFEKMMKWIVEFVNYLESIFPQYISNGSQAEFLERCHGIFLLIEKMRRPELVFCDLSSKIIHFWPVFHDQTEFKNYKQISTDE